MDGKGTIIDDDAPPGLTLDNMTIVEGSSSVGGSNVFFRVSLEFTLTASPVSVNYTTVNDSAVAPGDFTATSRYPHF